MAKPQLVASTQIKIDKNIPIPAVNAFGNRKYPRSTMEIGDSFYVPLTEFSPYKGEATLVKLQQSLVSANKTLAPKRFTTRTEGNGIRIWRIA